jgi:hypothetical protein
MWSIVIAALLRKGIVPFHAWVPEVFDRGRLGPAILFNAPQVGAYMTVVLIVPRASPEMLRVIAILALATAVYGAALALVQTSARRACGYLFMSQSALVMAGLDCTSASALAGGLLVWLSAGLAFAGLARCVLVVEARRGRLDLTKYHGGYERMPLLAITFLAMGLACTGFPGTLGFVGQELLVDGAVDAFPVMGFGVVIASALTGLAVLRMYFSLFCGRSDVVSHPSLRFGLTRPGGVDVRRARVCTRRPWYRPPSSRRFTLRRERGHPAPASGGDNQSFPDEVRHACRTHRSGRSARTHDGHRSFRGDVAVQGNRTAIANRRAADRRDLNRHLGFIFEAQRLLELERRCDARIGELERRRDPQSRLPPQRGLGFLHVAVKPGEMHDAGAVDFVEGDAPADATL